MPQHQEIPFYIKIVTKCIMSLTTRSVIFTEQSMLRPRQFNFKASLIRLARGVGYFTLRNSDAS